AGERDDLDAAPEGERNRLARVRRLPRGEDGRAADEPHERRGAAEEDRDVERAPLRELELRRGERAAALERRERAPDRPADRPEHVDPDADPHDPAQQEPDVGRLEHRPQRERRVPEAVEDAEHVARALDGGGEPDATHRTMLARLDAACARLILTRPNPSEEN